MKVHFVLFALALAIGAGRAAQNDGKAMNGSLQRLPRADRPGSAWSVRVDDRPLVFTEQVFARDLSANATAQTECMLDQLAAVIAPSGATLRHIGRLNIYVADDAVTPGVEAVLAKRFADAPPAVTLLRSPLPKNGALVGCDAIAVASNGSAAVTLSRGTAVMPAGGKIFVAGQAKRGPDFASSVAQTMEALHASVAHLGRGKPDVVHVKAFITPFSSHAMAKAEVEKSFAPGPVPPVVIIEWVSDLATEIEMVVAAPTLAAKGSDPIAFLSLPGMTTSPYFSRIATVAAGSPLIFISGLEGRSGDAREQWQQVFADLAGALLNAGSSFRHMAKATYFLADPKARQALGDIRGVYYDPARPPSASALDVKSLGRPGPRVALDMIAVPARSDPPK